MVRPRGEETGGWGGMQEGGGEGGGGGMQEGGDGARGGERGSGGRREGCHGDAPSHMHGLRGRCGCGGGGKQVALLGVEWSRAEQQPRPAGTHTTPHLRPQPRPQQSPVLQPAYRFQLPAYLPVPAA